jgi:hypothetical protein
MGPGAEVLFIATLGGIMPQITIRNNAASNRIKMRLTNLQDISIEERENIGRNVPHSCKSSRCESETSDLQKRRHPLLE